jgi:tRNA wybutosine-synthesizing protein 1
MTPTLFHCTQQCLFCWRAQSRDLQNSWDETELPTWDSPEEIFNGSVKAQLEILSGYKGNPKTDQKKIEEALTPRHVAISLTGEPTLYKHIGSLIKVFHNKEFTTFLVSNGTLPSVLTNLQEEPTQLYISLCAPNKEIFKNLCRPQIPKAWEKLNETLTLLPSFTCPTAIRITSVRNLNMKKIGAYSELIKKAKPTYIEVKAYLHIGYSRLRLNYENMPNFHAVRKFATELSDGIGYQIVDESRESRVVLLSRIEKPIKFCN